MQIEQTYSNRLTQITSFVDYHSEFDNSEYCDDFCPSDNENSILGYKHNKVLPTITIEPKEIIPSITEQEQSSKKRSHQESIFDEEECIQSTQDISTC